MRMTLRAARALTRRAGKSFSGIVRPSGCGTRCGVRCAGRGLDVSLFVARKRSHNRNMPIEKQRVRIWAALNLVGLIFTLVGGVLLFYCLTLKPSSYRLVKTSDGRPAICLDDKEVTTGYGGGFVAGDVCSEDWKHTGRTAEIVAERPSFVHCGLFLIFVGFFLQLPLALQPFVKGMS